MKVMGENAHWMNISSVAFVGNIRVKEVLYSSIRAKDLSFFKKKRKPFI